jgi:hypothetical protein
MSDGSLSDVGLEPGTPPTRHQNPNRINNLGPNPNGSGTLQQPTPTNPLIPNGFHAKYRGEGEGEGVPADSLTRGAH